MHTRLNLLAAASAALLLIACSDSSDSPPPTTSTPEVEVGGRLELSSDPKNEDVLGVEIETGGFKYEDIAIIYRTNATSLPF